ncbi:dTDP-glucose 4,6-dehydratase [Clostridium tertium]|uniref:dTDP-glucose 4,6-dehydratase n=1 Tax=Clostridium tertium TaxID=1559 RepID=UPI00232ABD95|nr:dTDP-glucose 4,6-dehydratase [Clostridium tertium]MDB1944581.1 dTDP-glucose 4,6-dehydratase [Clostridium tertium]MDB1951848.1 dTDP-glucose 4,6-dehydratase [Clostridium tertium]
MKTYLVTGGAGFIGSNFVLYMLKKYEDIRIINLDKLTYAGNLENLKSIEGDSRHIFVQGDICDVELVSSLFEKYEIDYVAHFAAESHVDRSIKEPEVFAKTNVLGTVNLLNCSKNAWETENGWKTGVKFLHVSTDEVYGSLGEIGYFMETTPLDPHSPYSASKAGSDMMVKAYGDTYKMPINITRCSNNYGPFQFPEKLIPLLINNCLQLKDLPIYGDGLNIRDWLYVEDHAKAIDMAINNGRLGEVYNVGGHNERTNIQIVDTVIKYINENVDSKVTENLKKFVEDRKGHDRRYGIDPSKIKEELGWYPETTFEVGIVKTINWYLDNKEWMDNVTSGDYQKYYENMYK